MLMTMYCSEFLDRYSDYDDSLLSLRELSEFRAHLEACPSCARYDRVLRKGRMLARQIPPLEPRLDFGARLQRRLSGGRGRPRSGVVLPPFAAAAMAAVTVLMVATTALSLLDRGAARAAEVEAAGPVRLAGLGTPAVPGRGWAAPSPAMVVPVALRGRSVVLPTSSPRPSGAWAAERVDRRRASSYSPVVTGPPAYRATRAYLLGPTTPTRRMLD